VDGKVHFATNRKPKKVENLRTTPHATVTVDIYGEDWSA
jgi:nitroimidazol reductase NimA-like FMN-containing flavoprotein (pyridoxamine 5'-phosphate oxidase superfamily)